MKHQGPLVCTLEAPAPQSLQSLQKVLAHALQCHPGIAWRLHSPHAHHRARLDALFERTVQVFRQAMVAALDTEPMGDARHLRAYLRCLCDNALHPPKGRLAAAALMTDGRYQAIWADFIGEACAYDACDALLSLHCRAAAQTLWIQQALQRHANPQRISQMKDHLLALTERPQHSLAHWPHEPHCTH